MHGLLKDEKGGLHETTGIIAVVAALIVGSGLALRVAQSQEPGTERTDLQRRDLSVPGREVVQARVDFDPGYVCRCPHSTNLTFDLERFAIACTGQYRER